MSMNGAESLVTTLLACGVDTCFANPGTSEMHFVSALDRVAGMRCVLGLFEGVVTGAADGYARAAGKPAATLLHCGPGLANGLANLHNARRAAVPVVNCVGDQAITHRAFDAPLTADTEGFARGVSAWVRTASSAAQVGADAAAAVQAARTGAGGVATLILPSDTCWGEGGVPAAPLPVPARPQASPKAIAEVAELVRRGEPTLFYIEGDGLRAGPLADAARIGAATGAEMWCPSSFRRLSQGAGRHSIRRTPYPVDAAVATFAHIRHVVLVGTARPPVGFFGYPGKPDVMTPVGASVHVLARPEQDVAAALAALAEALGAPAVAPAARVETAPGRGAVTPEGLGASLAALMPEGAFVVDESVSFARGVVEACHGALPHEWMTVTGGAIGNGIPMATGAAVGAPGRRVINLEADGSAMYTLQGLWTQARENLDVTTVILANKRYQILFGELVNVGAKAGPATQELFSLARPELDFVKLAAGMGVPAARAETMEAFNDLFAAANRRRGPFLIELAVD